LFSYRFVIVIIIYFDIIRFSIDLLSWWSGSFRVAGWPISDIRGLSGLMARSELLRGPEIFNIGFVACFLPRYRRRRHGPPGEGHTVIKPRLFYDEHG